MDYSEARRTLASLPTRVKPGLDRIERLLDALGRPEQTFPAIHIAGTNGKGSVAAMLSAVLSRAGYRVGRFTSPELVDYRDRIEVDGEWIPKERFAEIVTRLSPGLAGADPPTEFEVLAAVAFRYFADEAVDIAVVEVGLGGRFDATNVVQPIVSVLTTVGRDHLDLLGDSIARIAWEKVGIVRRGVPLVVGDLPPAADAVVVSEARAVSARVVRASHEIELAPIHRGLDGARYRVRASGLPDEVEIPFPPEYEGENLRCALAAIRELRKAGWKIPDTAIVAGLRTVTWPGRFEVMGRAPLIVLDGAHNAPGAHALARAVERFFPPRPRRTLLFGILRNKEIGPVCDALFPQFPRIVLTRSSSPRALPPEELVPHARRWGIEPIVTSDVRAGLAAAVSDLGGEDGLLVTGSLTVVQEARPGLVEEVRCVR